MTWTDRNPRGGNKGAIQRAREQGEASGERGETERRERRGQQAGQGQGKSRGDRRGECGGVGNSGSDSDPGAGEREQRRGWGWRGPRQKGRRALRGERESGGEGAGRRAGAAKDREGKGRGSDARESRGAPRWDGVLSLFFLGFWGGRRISAEITQPSPPAPRPSERPQLYKYRGWGSRAAAQGSATPEKALLSLAN